MINLLPQQEKNKLLQQKKVKVVLILAILLFITSVFTGVLLFAVKIYGLGELQAQKFLITKESQSSENPQAKELEENVSRANAAFAKLNNFYQRQSDIAGFLEKISNLLPPDVYLTNFSYQKDKSQVILRGESKTRDLLLQFKKSLEGEEKIKDLYSPISNLIKNTDIEFYFSFVLVN